MVIFSTLGFEPTCLSHVDEEWPDATTSIQVLYRRFQTRLFKSPRLCCFYLTRYASRALPVIYHERRKRYFQRMRSGSHHIYAWPTRVRQCPQRGGRGFPRVVLQPPPGAVDAALRSVRPGIGGGSAALCGWRGAFSPPTGREALSPGVLASRLPKRRRPAARRVFWQQRTGARRPVESRQAVPRARPANMENCSMTPGAVKVKPGAVYYAVKIFFDARVFDIP